MPTFRQIAKGTRARKVIDFPIHNTRCEILADVPELAAQRARDRAAWEQARQAGEAPPVAPDDTIKVDLRVLTGAEESLVLQRAREHAIAHGVTDPKPGDDLFEIGRAAWSVALGCLDHDSAEQDPKPFFEGGAKEVLDELDADKIGFLFARWELWQGECSLAATSMTSDQFYEQVVRVTVSDDSLPFSQMAPVTQWVLVRTLGALLLNSPEAKSHFTSAYAGKPTAKMPTPKPVPSRASKRNSRRSR